MLNILYERDRYNDVLIDENNQLCFPFMSLCRYDVPREDWSEFVGYYYKDYSHRRVYGNEVKFIGDDVLFIEDNLILNNELVCKYTGVVDVNGRPLYTKDFVRIDELGWCGFLFDEGEDGVCVLGNGGFSSNPNNIEYLGNPVLGDVSDELMNYLIAHEQKFMKENRIPLNTKKEFNLLNIDFDK